MKLPNNPLANKTILLVNTGSIKKRFIVQKLKKLGLTIVCLNKEKNWAQPYIDHWIIADNTNHAESILAIKDFIANHNNITINGSLTFWEDDVLLNAKIIDCFNFIGVPYNIANKTRNKFLFREFCKQHNIPAPQHYLIKNEGDLKNIKETFKFPVVIKPAYGSSSAYVVKIEKPDDLSEMYHYVINNVSTGIESALSDGLDIFIEEYIDGDEVDIDILIQNGKIKYSSVSDNFNKNKGIFFIDSGQGIPSNLPLQTQNIIIEMAEMTLEKLGIQNGCIHFEAKYSSHGFFPIEVNLRMGGDYVYSYNKSAWDIDLIEYSALIACGEYIPKIHLPEIPKKFIIGWDLHPEESGILAELIDPENIQNHSHIEEIQIYKSVGDPIFVPPEGFEHIGWLTVSGENTLDAQDNLDEILENISFKVVKFDPESSLGKTERKNKFSAAVLNKELLIRTARIKKLKQNGINNFKQIKIGLLANIYQNPSDTITQQITQSSLNVQKILEQMGGRLTIINLNDNPNIYEDIKKSDVDLIFNLGESLNGKNRLKPHIAALIESWGIPYTGSDMATHLLTTDKIKFKKILKFHDIPTPEWDYAYTIEDEIDDELELPLIIKLANADYLEKKQIKILKNKKDFQKELLHIIKELKQPALIEEYIEGGEYDIFILGNAKENLRVLPLIQKIFSSNLINNIPDTIPSDESNNIIRQLPPKKISRRLETLITEMALDTYSYLNCQDYGQVKIKLDNHGNPYVINLNPTPLFYPHDNDGIVAAAKMAGLSFPELLREIIEMCIERYRQKAK